MQYIVFFDQNGVAKVPVDTSETEWNKIKQATGVGADVNWPVFGLWKMEDNGVGHTFLAMPFLGGGSLEAWRLPASAEKPSTGLPDPKGWRPIADGLPDVVPLDVGTFQYLFLAYNREGGPQINVVATDRASNKKFDPTKTKLQPGAKGDYAVFPCREISFVPPGKTPSDGPAKVAQESFTWNPDGIVLRTDPQPGSFWWLPASEEHVDLTLEFKQELPVALPKVDDPSVIGQRYVFDGWERNSLSNWVKGSEHQWVGGSGDPCTFDRESFTGIIAYYRIAQTRVPKARGKMYKPGPIDKGCPFNDLGIYEAGGVHFFNLKELAEGKIIARSDRGGRPAERTVPRQLSAQIRAAAARLRLPLNDRVFDREAAALSNLLAGTSPR